MFKGEACGVRGFWQRMAKHRLKLLLRFGNALPVNKHLDFRKRGEALVCAQFATAWRSAMARALGGKR